MKLAPSSMSAASEALIGVIEVPAGEAQILAPSAGASQQQELVPLGCIAKLLTGGMLRAILRDKYALPATELLGHNCGGSATLEAVSADQLWNHSHGLDCPAETVPMASDGHIDAGDLLAQIGTTRRRWLAGTEIYSYSDIGGWLMGAILEHQSGASFMSMLTRYLTDEPVVRETHGWELLKEFGRSAPCPSTGGTLMMPATTLLRCLQQIIATEPEFADPLRVSERMLALPGWHPMECGIYRGWKCYPQGWLGHNTVVGKCTVIVRYSPMFKKVIVACTQNASVLRTLGDVLELPGLSAFRPAPVPLTKMLPLEVQQHCGTYGDAQWRIVVAPSGGAAGALQIDVSRHGSAGIGPYHRAYLVPHSDGVFMCNPPRWPEVGFVQFRENASNGCRYLWNGRRTWPRIWRSDVPPLLSSGRV